MRRGPSIAGRPYAVAEFLRSNGPAKLAAIAAGTGLEHQSASVALCVGKGHGLVQVSCRGRNGIWSACATPAPQPASRLTPKPAAKPRASTSDGGPSMTFSVASGQVAALRTAPVFRPLQQAAAAGPLRPGAENYRAVPSLYGDERIAYHGARPISTTATGAGASSGVK